MTATQTCSYCGRPAETPIVRVQPGDVTSPRLAFGTGHEACRLEHSEALRRLQAEADALAEAAR